MTDPTTDTRDDGPAEGAELDPSAYEPPPVRGARGYSPPARGARAVIRSLVAILALAAVIVAIAAASRSALDRASAPSIAGVVRHLFSGGITQSAEKPEEEGGNLEEWDSEPETETAAVLAAEPSGTPIPAFVYRDIHPTRTGPFVVSPLVFGTMVDFLDEHGYTPITVQDMLAARSGSSSMPADPVLLTFDGGLATQYGYAASILDEHGFKATFFVPPGLIGKPGYMTREELAELSVRGFDIETLGWTPPKMPSRTRDVSATASQLSRSAAWIADATGIRAVAFAYQDGVYNEHSRALLEKAGLSFGFSQDVGANGGDVPAWRLRRYLVTKDFDESDLAVRLGHVTPVLSYAEPKPGSAAERDASFAATVEMRGAEFAEVRLSVDGRLAAKDFYAGDGIADIRAEADKPLGPGFHTVTISGKTSAGRRFAESWGFNVR